MKNSQNGPSHPVTMRDVAKHAGVSEGTVSRVLNDTNTAIAISEKTRQRVLQAAEELRYIPNLAARSLRTQRTHLIAIMIADISNPFYHSIVRTIQDTLHVHEYDVLIANTDHIYEYEQRFCQAVMRRSVDGVIMVPFHLTDDEIDQLIRRTGTSVVALGKHIQHPTVDIVYADDERATYNAVTWLAKDKGHRSIGFLGVPDSFPPGARRLRGYHQALVDAHCDLSPTLVRHGEFSADSGYQGMRALLDMPTPPTAVFACNDIIAMGAISCAQDVGVRIPQDIAVVGFDNIPEATLIRPCLTTVAQHPARIGKQLAEALLERMTDQVTGERRLFEVPCTLIERETA